MSDNTPGLIVHSLEIGKVLAEHDQAILHAKGMCMYPLVHPGDRLHIHSRCVEQVNIGDIAVCRREGRLVCHRTVDKGICNGCSYIVTRSDRNRRNNDPFIYDEDLLGIVTCIERKGRFTDPNADTRKGPDRVIALRRLLMDLYGAFRGHLFALLSAVQKTPVYQYGGRSLKAFSRCPARYEVRVWKESWRKLGLYMPLKPEEFDIDGLASHGHPLKCWALVLHPDSPKEPAAQATFQSKSGKWHLNDLQVRPRYCGMGLEKDLLAKADEIFNRNGILNWR
jgi:hypothetical protein